jgi:alkanesulfonate monooxygenase SsuD/methylene tetrahydromethanopterin reductase-like flavin-dependent oxidoreductase (luciferase family)
VPTGLGLDARLGLSVAQLRDLAPEAARLGYASLWTNAGGPYDALHLCAAWAAVAPLPTGIAAVPIQWAPPRSLGISARTVADLSGGRLVLGIGSGTERARPIAAVREYLSELRAVVGDVPLYVAALGPQMLRLAGQVADGVELNWCTPERIAWSRERIARDIPVVMYIRVCVDDDVPAARAALAKQVLAYALARPGQPLDKGYRGHFARMGFDTALRALEAQRERGASEDALVAAVPSELLDAVGYAGPASGLRAALARFSGGLDLPIVRVLSARPGTLEPVRSAIRAALA